MSNPKLVATAILLIAATGISVLISFAFPANLSQFDWLVGTWKRETAKSITFETWRRLSDRTYEGESHRISKASGDTVFVEHLLIAEMGAEVFYIPKVAENEYPIAFKLTAFENHKATFKNPTHDFPQWISYELLSDGSLTALTGGTIDGREKIIEFHFNKVE